MPYNPAMDTLGPRLKRAGTVKLPERKMSASSAQYFNRGVSSYAATRLGGKRRTPLTHSQYYNAGVLTAYGQTDQAQAELGDLFNDIMGSVVPGWAQRPDALKKIVVRPDPAKLVTMAQKVAPQAAGQIVTAANQAGFNVYANTPAGQIPVSPGTAQSLYQGYPLMASSMTTLQSIPMWVWLAGGGAIVGLILFARK